MLGTKNTKKMEVISCLLLRRVSYKDRVYVSFGLFGTKSTVLNAKYSSSVHQLLRELTIYTFVAWQPC